MIGDIKHKFPSRTSKEILVKRIQKITATSAVNSKMNSANIQTESLSNSTKRKLDSNNENKENSNQNKIVSVKKPRNCLPVLTEMQIVQMKRVLAITGEQLLGMKHDAHLRPLWDSIGMTSMYPHMTGKEKVMTRLKAFAESNLRFHRYIL